MMDPTAAQNSPSETGKTPSVDVVQRTDVGLVRSENQDFAIINSVEEEQGNPGRGRLMVVADGMGGHRGGATASRMAATIVKTEYMSSEDADLSAALKTSLERANARVYAEAQSNPELRGMGTTCSCLVILGSKGYVAHVGDSRIYMLRNGEIRQLTDDHSLVASMVREGLLTAKEAENHPRRNVLQRSMGVSQEVEIDTFTLDIHPGDTFILCSDGLHGLVKQEEMAEVAKQPITEAASEFVKRSLDRGAPDNVTVVVAHVGQQSDVQIAGASTPASLVKTVAIPAITVESPADLDETVRVPPLPAENPPTPHGETFVPPPPAASSSSLPKTQPGFGLSNEAAGTQPLSVESPPFIADPDSVGSSVTPEVSRGSTSLARWTILLLLLAAVAAGLWFWNGGRIDWGAGSRAGRSSN